MDNLRRDRALLALGISCGLAGCEAIELPVGVDLVLPADDSDLTRTDNVSVVLEPAATTETFTADGLDFSVSLSIAPLSTPQRISVFLAEGETLLAWGSTPPVPLTGQTDVSLLVARPDVLSSFDATFDAPDPLARAAAVGDIGMLVVAADGTTLFLDVFGWQLRAADPIETDAVLDASDGTLLGDPAGGAQRIGIADGLSIQRFDPVSDQWSARDIPDDAQATFGARAQAALVASTDGAALWVIGGGTMTDTVAVGLHPEQAVGVDVLDVPPLDTPRPGATALALDRGDDNDGLLVFGGNAMSPVAWWVDAGLGVGPTEAWTGAGCIALDAPTGDTVRVLCAGGVRAGVPTGDGLIIFVPTQMAGADEAPSVMELPDLLQGPMADPLLLPGTAAVYAQGEGRAVAIRRDDLSVEASPTAPDRAQGGDTAHLPLGVTFVVGGAATDGTPVSRWSYFAPQPG